MNQVAALDTIGTTAFSRCYQFYHHEFSFFFLTFGLELSFLADKNYI